MVTTTIGEQHQPRRPEWTCLACDQPWPCEPRRDSMRDDSWDPVTRALAMGLRYAEALGDLPPADASELWARFFAWIR